MTSIMGIFTKAKIRTKIIGIVIAILEIESKPGSGSTATIIIPKGEKYA